MRLILARRALIVTPKWFDAFLTCVWLGSMLLVLRACFPAPAAADVPANAHLYRNDLIRSARSVMGLDAPIATLAAQVHQESTWRASVTSHAGAQGLTQFMPVTAVWIAQLFPDLYPADTYNPGWSLRAMVRYDQWLLSRIKASSSCEKWAFTLSAYNGGLGWVIKDKKLAQASGACELAFFDHVERFNSGRSDANFLENRRYVTNILTQLERTYARINWGNGACYEF